MTTEQSRMSFKERNWRRLMSEMEKGNVIPVIGPELLMINYEGHLCPFYSVVARLLSARLEVNIDSDDPAEVIYAYTQGGKKDITEPYYEIRDILKEYRFEIPESLRVLAGINVFNIFITTTFDDLMMDALNEVRFGGARRTIKLYYERGTGKQDISDAMLQSQVATPIVYHIFGAAMSQPYVVTEDDLLEFEHFWQDEDRRPKRISSLLKDKYILILGCNFQNWLSRFFLYTFKTDSLFKSSEILSLIADGKSRNDKELVLFLSRCQTHLYPDEVSEFVRELSSRWDTYSKANTTSLQQWEEESDKYVKDALFLSYASEDKAFVVALKERLERRGINVWFDKKELSPGDGYQKKIIQNIEESSFFLPIISRHVLTGNRRFFRVEWNHALEEAKYRPSKLPFIIPVVIDDTSENDPNVKEFGKIHWERCLDGEIGPEFIDLIVGYVRNIRRNELVK